MSFSINVLTDETVGTQGLQFDLRWLTLEKLEILRICTLPSKSQGVIVIVCQSFQIYQKIKGKKY